MLPDERRNSIMATLQEKGSVSVVELVKAFSVSEETIRRDLLQMAQEGLLRRVHGGAFLSNVVRETITFGLRKESMKQSKLTIAQECCGLIKSGNTLFLDSSTTALYIAQRMRNLSHISVITNAFGVISALHDYPDIKVIAIGGELDRNLDCFTGYSTLENLKNYHADIAFVSCTGVSLQDGLTDSDEMEGRIRYAMLKNAQKRFLIADSYKFNKTMMYQIMSLSELDGIISEKTPGKEWEDELRRLNISFYFDPSFDKEKEEK